MGIAILAISAFARTVHMGKSTNVGGFSARCCRPAYSLPVSRPLQRSETLSLTGQRFGGISSAFWMSDVF